MKKFLSVVCALVMVLGLMSVTAYAAELTDGVFEGTGKSFGGDLKVAVTVEGGKITYGYFAEHMWNNPVTAVTYLFGILAAAFIAQAERRGFPGGMHGFHFPGVESLGRHCRAGPDQVEISQLAGGSQAEAQFARLVVVLQFGGEEDQREDQRKTVGLDPQRIIQFLKARGIGVLITDHNVRETLEIVDRAYILHDGAVLKHGTTDEIVRDEMVRRVYLGENFRII